MLFDQCCLLDLCPAFLPIQLAGGQAVENGVSVIFTVDGIVLGSSIDPIFPCFFLAMVLLPVQLVQWLVRFEAKWS